MSRKEGKPFKVCQKSLRQQLLLSISQDNESYILSLQII